MCVEHFRKLIKTTRERMHEELWSIKSFMQAFSVTMPTELHGLHAVWYVFEPLPNECNIHAYQLHSIDEFISVCGS
jgi:hypothetical protein